MEITKSQTELLERILSDKFETTGGLFELERVMELIYALPLSDDFKKEKIQAYNECKNEIALFG